MPIESGLWVALPRGVDDASGRLRVTLAVSPRLRSDADGGSLLAEYPLFSRWARVVQALPWAVEVEGVGRVDATPDPASPAPDPATWEAVFAGDVGVEDHVPRDLSDRRVSSYPVSEVAADLLATYTAVGLSSPVAPPRVSAGPLRDFVEDVVRWQRHPERLEGVLEGAREGERSRLVEGRRGRFLPRDRRQALGRAGTFGVGQRFYDRRLEGERLHRPGDGGASPGLPTLPRPERPLVDFHRYVAALADYPTLLRMLGLAVDLLVDDPGLPARGRIRAVFPDPPADWFAAAATSPWTNFEAELPWFVPRPRKEADGPFSRGQLHFNRQMLGIHQIDVDGSLLKVLNAADSLSTQSDAVLAAEGRPSMTADAGSLPALRGAGFTVSRDERAADVVHQLDRSVLAEEQVAADAPADLFAEDVYRGFVVDVDKDGQGFASLCRRQGRYTVVQPDDSRIDLEVPPDEGYVKGASTTSVPGDEELYLHEALFSWSGWSLVAGRPGRRLTPEESLATPGERPLERATEVPLVTSFVPEPGTLTSLRYGSRYRLRARLADLSGATVGGSALETHEEPSQGETFLRWEPVPAPVVLPRRAYGEGESQLRMVVRSTLGSTPEQYVALDRVASLAGHTDPGTAYLAHDSRWIVPPGTSQQMAERHGVFDAAFGPAATTADRRAAYDVAARESGKLGEVEPGDQLLTPYLPDVSSRAAAFSVLPGHPTGSSFVQRWPASGSEWWDRQPFRLEVVGGPAPAPATPDGSPLAPAWDADARVLRVHVPQAEVVRVRLSSGLDPDDLGLQGAWSLLAAQLPASVRAQALEGRLWMVTPSLELVLVHAVEKPLTAPVVDVPQEGMLRREGDHFVALTGAIDNHARSTGRLDVDAEWTEQVDDVGMPAPRDGVDGREPLLRGHAHVGGFDLEATEDGCRVGTTDVSGNGLPTRHQLRHELGDTRHRLVSYRARATSRFREYFAPEVAATTEDVAGEQVPVIEHRGGWTQLHVPSSRRPAPPQVVSVVPTFAWTESTEVGRPRQGRGFGLSTTTVRRRTCGLRVHLRRPWFSSGDGELLGVVLKRQPWLAWWVDAERGFTVPEAARVEADRLAERVLDRGLARSVSSSRNPASLRLLRGLGVTTSGLRGLSSSEVSQAVVQALDPIGIELGPLFPLPTRPAPADVLTRWGADPAQLSPGPSGGPYIHQLGLRTHVATDVAPAEDPLSRVTVVGHQPFWDADRSLWACDVELPAGSAYTPFVQLALCRFQRWSVPGLEMSPVVRADFAQLLPTRELRVDSGTPTRVTVTGPAGSAGGPLEARRVTARVETRPVGGDDLDWRPLGPTVDLSGSVADARTSDVTWTGRVVPQDAPSGHERRLLVEEFERHPTDNTTDDPWAAVTSKTMFGLTFSTRERLVYADSVPL